MRREQVSFWWTRFARLLAGASSTIVLAAAGAVRNKWLAHHLDTIGIGALSQVVSGQVWIGTAAGLGLTLPIARAVGAGAGSGEGSEAAREAGRRAAWAGAFLAAAAACAAVLLGLLAAPLLSRALLGTTAYAGTIRVSMFGVAGIALFTPASGVFAGRSDIRAQLTFAIAGGGGATILAFLLVPRFGLMGGAAAATAIYPLGLLGMLWFHGPAHAGAVGPRPASLLANARREAGPLLRVAGAALALSLLDLGTMVALRAHYLRANGVDANGLLQAALALSQQVGALFYAYLSGYGFGKVNAIYSSEGVAGVRAYTRRQWAPLLGLAIVVVGVSAVAAAPLLHIFYSSRFDAARPLMAYALFGEMARVAVQAVGLGSLAVGGTRLWFAIGIAQPAALAAAYGFFARSGAGAASLPYAYAAAGWITLAVALVLLARKGVTLDRRGLALAAVAFAALGLLARWVAG